MENRIPPNSIEAEKYVFKNHLNDNSLKTIEAGTGGGRISFYLEGYHSHLQKLSDEIFFQ